MVLRPAGDLKPDVRAGGRSCALLRSDGVAPQPGRGAAPRRAVGRSATSVDHLPRSGIPWFGWGSPLDDNQVGKSSRCACRVLALGRPAHALDARARRGRERAGVGSGGPDGSGLRRENRPGAGRGAPGAGSGMSRGGPGAVPGHRPRGRAPDSGALGAGRRGRRAVPRARDGAGDTPRSSGARGDVVAARSAASGPGGRPRGAARRGDRARGPQTLERPRRRIRGGAARHPHRSRAAGGGERPGTSGRHAAVLGPRGVAPGRRGPAGRWTGSGSLCPRGDVRGALGALAARRRAVGGRGAIDGAA